MRRNPSLPDSFPLQKYADAKRSKRAMESTWTSIQLFTFVETFDIGPTSNKNVGGRTRSIVAMNTWPPILYAGAVSGGVWKSVDGGQSWTPLTDLMVVFKFKTEFLSISIHNELLSVLNEF